MKNPGSKNAWLDIWQSKYQPSKQPLHKSGGFDNISASEYSRMIRYFLTKLSIKKTDRVLEVGCGSGAFLREIDDYQTITGIDYSANSIEQARKNINGNFSVGEANSLPFAAHSFDIVCVWSIFQYFDTMDYADQVMGELMRVATHNGKIFIGDICDIEKRKLYDQYEKELNDKRQLVSEITPKHMWYEKEYFIKQATNNGWQIEILDEDIAPLSFYIQSKWRFSVIMNKI